MHRAGAAAAFANEGCLVLPGFFAAAEAARCRALCDRILDQWLAEQASRNPGRRQTNMAYLTEPRYFRDRPSDLVELLELIADPRILETLAAAGIAAPVFHNTQYFHNPPGSDWNGPWHRDTQFLASDPAVERQRLAGFQSLHFRIAFCDDARLQYVPGSEQRWDTPEEEAIRQSATANAAADSVMPGARTLALRTGDAALFHAWGIHRGQYGSAPPRRTFDAIYTWGGVTDWGIAAPTCFAVPAAREALLNALTPEAQAFFRRFVAANLDRWAEAD